MSDLYLNRSEVRIALIKRNDADGLKAIDALPILVAEDIVAPAPEASAPREVLAKTVTAAALQALGKGGDNLAIYNAVFAALPQTAATAAAPRTVIDQIADILGEIEGLSQELRSGGPDPMDLQGLSDGLSQACDLATEAGNLLASLTAAPTTSPEPDAVRKALEAAREYIGADNNPRSNRVLGMILAALSAPVAGAWQEETLWRRLDLGDGHHGYDQVVAFVPRNQRGAAT